MLSLPVQAPAPKPAAPPKKYTMSDLSTLKEMVVSPDANQRKIAAKAFYELSDVSHKKNRAPMVRADWEIVENLCECMLMQEGDARHLALLAINNLSIPSENKRAFIAENHSTAVISALLNIIDNDPSEAYLASICLMNLSFLESSVPVIAGFPGLLHTMETVLKDGAKAKSGSGKSESVRWACGLLKVRVPRRYPVVAVRKA